MSTEKEEHSPPSKRSKTSKIQLQTGHDCLLTKEPPEHLQIECSICLCVLCDPMLIDCSCGACFCGRCIEPTLEAKKPCPLCNSPFKTLFPDRRLQRTLKSLKVYCSFKEAGCEWLWGAVCLKITLGVDVYDRMRYLAPKSIFSECLCLRSIVTDLAIDVYLPFITGSRCLRQDAIFSSTVQLMFSECFCFRRSIFSDELQVSLAIDV